MAVNKGGGGGSEKGVKSGERCPGGGGAYLRGNKESMKVKEQKDRAETKTTDIWRRKGYKK